MSIDADVEPGLRIELRTYALQVRCSTTELTRRALRSATHIVGQILSVHSDVTRVAHAPLHMLPMLRQPTH